jgi:RNA polymerase sigma-70 factor (ECF subfamily)
MLEQAVDSLSEPYRLVFMLREVEGMSTTQTGLALGLGDEVVKTRLHRARAMIRGILTERFGTVVAGAFQFHGPRCDRVVSRVPAQSFTQGLLPRIAIARGNRRSQTFRS